MQEQVAGTVARAFVAIVVVLFDLCIPNFALVLIDDISFEFKNAIITGRGCESLTVPEKERERDAKCRREMQEPL